MKWLEETITSWNDFQKLIPQLGINEDGDAGWYFRGQADKKWGLVPSILREFKGVSIDIEKGLGIEFTAFREFTSKAHLYLDNSNNVDRSSWSMVAWWMLMQHHYCPTRLLDWTLSPYVAAYFAAEKHHEKDGAIWLFPSYELENIMKDRYDYPPKDDAIYETHELQAVRAIMGAQHSIRSSSQQGVYTVCTYLFGDHEELIGEAFTGQEDRYPLHKLIIPASLKPEFLSQLRLMNITGSTLFQGIDGLGKAAGEMVKLRIWRNK